MKVTILSPVEHDGKPLKVGDTVDLKAPFAQALIAAGAASCDPQALKAAEREAAAKAEADRLAAEQAEAERRAAEKAEAERLAAEEAAKKQPT